MNLTAFRCTLQAPGMPAGHTFLVPADSVPHDRRQPVGEVLAAAAEHVTDRLVFLRVGLVYEPGQHGSRSVGPERQRRHERRLVAALADFLGCEPDPARRAEAQKLLALLKPKP